MLFIAVTLTEGKLLCVQMALITICSAVIYAKVNMFVNPQWWLWKSSRKNLVFKWKMSSLTPTPSQLLFHRRPLQLQIFLPCNKVHSNRSGTLAYHSLQQTASITLWTSFDIIGFHVSSANMSEWHYTISRLLLTLKVSCSFSSPFLSHVFCEICFIN